MVKKSGIPVTESSGNVFADLGFDAPEEELRAHRRRNPNFERAVEVIVEAETTAKEDPAEGKVVDETGRTQPSKHKTR